MKVKDLIKQLRGYEDFDIDCKVYLKVNEEELQVHAYRYPYDLYNAELSISDIGHSSNTVCIGVDIKENRE